jgi:hypothetical protein
MELLRFGIAENIMYIIDFYLPLFPQDYTCLQILVQDIGKATPFTCLEVINDKVWAGTQVGNLDQITL